MVELGDTVRDKITGFEGIAIEMATYLNGCVQFEVQPPINKEGKIPDSVWIDEQQLVVIEVSEIEVKVIPKEVIMIELGNEVRDTLLGFEGIAISRNISITGYIQYEVQPKKDKEDKLPDSAYVNAKFLEVTKAKNEKKKPKKEDGGGIRKHPPK